MFLSTPIFELVGCLVLDELRQAQCAGQPGGAAADNGHVRFHQRVLDIGNRFAEDHPSRGCQASEFQTLPFAFFTSSISGGTISNKLPTMPISLTSKIGASLSLLIAMMVRAPFMPTMCWMAPLMPSAR